jgi:hypothetical protein
MDTKSITTRKSLTPDVWNMINDLAPVMHASRLFGVASKEQAAAIMLKGYELGIPVTSAFEFIHVIQGKPSLNPRGAMALVQQSGKLADMKIDDIDKDSKPYSCHVWMKRVNGMEYQCTVTMDDAKRAGLIKPDSGWQSWPANMLRARATGFVMDVLFADVLGGMKRADEYGADLDGEGEVVDAQWNVTTPNGHNPTLIELTEKYGAEAIMQANGGAIPANDEEVAVVAEKLEKAQ